MMPMLNDMESLLLTVLAFICLAAVFIIISVMLE